MYVCKGAQERKREREREGERESFGVRRLLHFELVYCLVSMRGFELFKNIIHMTIIMIISHRHSVIRRKIKLFIAL